jgi:hypothetical protein
MVLFAIVEICLEPNRNHVNVHQVVLDNNVENKEALEVIITQCSDGKIVEVNVLRVVNKLINVLLVLNQILIDLCLTVNVNLVHLKIQRENVVLQTAIPVMKMVALNAMKVSMLKTVYALKSIMTNKNWPKVVRLSSVDATLKGNLDLFAQENLILENGR